MSIRILVVDDNRDTLRLYVKALGRRIKHRSSEAKVNETLEIEDAYTIASALTKLKEQPYEILIVDLKIPGLTGEEMGGLELIEESLRLDPLRPIIAITGYGSVALARRTLTRGVFDFIEKSESAVGDIIFAVQRALDSREERITRSGNPFTPMSGIEPSVFGGRTKELEFFVERLSKALHSRYCEHFLVLGDWGIGKSTLFKEYKKICQSRGHIACIVPLECIQPGTPLSEAARSIVEGILRDLPFQFDRFKKIANYFDSVGINILGTCLEFGRDTSKKELSPQAFFHDTLLNLWQDLKDKTEVVVILLDDLDNFTSVSEIVMTLKQTLSMDSIKNTHILLGISSTPMNWRELTSIKKHHPLSRYFLSRVELAPLSEGELRETILKSLLGTGVSFSTEIITRVFEYTNEHPFEMQVLCNHLFNNQISRRVDMDVWDKALQTAIYDMGIATFDHWFTQASREEAKVLRAIAQSGMPVSVKELHKLAEESVLKVPPRNVAKYLQRLIDKKLIDKSGRGLYTVPDKLFRAYTYSCRLKMTKMTNWILTCQL